MRAGRRGLRNVTFGREIEKDIVGPIGEMVKAWFVLGMDDEWFKR